jgi:hypothetical protein
MTRADGCITTRSQYLRRLEALQADAGASAAAVRALELLGRARGWDTPTPKRPRRPAPLPADPIASRRIQLEEVRARMAAAEFAASHVAARGYRADARELERDIEAMEERQRLAAVDAQDHDTRLRRFREDLRTLPITMRRAIRAIVLEEVEEDA